VRFANPDMLWLILALIPMGLATLWSIGRRRKALQRFAGDPEYLGRFDGQVNVHLRAAKLLLLYFAMFAAIVASARPQWGTRLEPVTRRGVDVVVVLDHSLSMAAEDLAPNRLSHAKHAIDTLLQQMAGDRVALVTFAGQASLLCPLTLDHAAIRLFLDTVDVESVQVPGTALAEALKLALETFGERQPDGGERSRALVLFTDGEDHEGGVEDVIRDIEKAGVSVYAVGCGTTRGAPIPVTDESGMHTGYKKDREDRVVTTRLDEGVLELLALDSGGRYYRATAGEAELEEIARGLMGMDTQELGAVLRARYEDRFQIPLILAALALLAETMVGDGRRARPSLKRAEGQR
jgi:Ca-activated chloride channel family protein